jgi:hypothetical protein
MRFTDLLIPLPAADPDLAPTQALLARAGYVHKIAPARLALLPLGMRVLHRIERILRQELNRAGAQEVRAPAGQPRALEDLLVLGTPAQEPGERLPLALYQIQEHPGPGWGLIRHEGCSLHPDEAAARKGLHDIGDACARALRRCGVDTQAFAPDPFTLELHAPAGQATTPIAALRVLTGDPPQASRVEWELGVSLLLEIAAALHHDAAGLTWPTAIAPFHATVLALTPDAAEPALRVYDELGIKGVDVLLDDRGRPAADVAATADLLGVPVRVAVSAPDAVEVSRRDGTLKARVALEDAAAYVTTLVQRELEVPLAQER